MANLKTEYEEDPVITQCAIAYINWRCSGGQGDWEPFRRQWLLEHAAAETARLKKETVNG